MAGAKKMLNGRKKSLPKIAVSIFLIGALIIVANPSTLADTLTGVDPILLFIVIILYLLNLLAKCVRWSLLIDNAIFKIPFRSVLVAYAIGQALNNITPGRVLGEASRVARINAVEKVPMGAGVATVGTERVMDFILLIIVAGSGMLLLAPFLLPAVRDQLVFVIEAMIVVNLFIIGIMVYPKLSKTIAFRISRLLLKISDSTIARRIAHGLNTGTKTFNDALRPKGKNSKRTYTIAAGMTVLIWLNEAARLWIILMALGVTVELPAIMVAMSLSSLSAIVLAVGSGNILVSSAVFTAVGVNANLAVSAGLLSALTSVWLSVPIAILAILLSGSRSYGVEKAHRTSQSSEEG